VDEAGRGVAAEQRALRPAQHFDPLDLAKLVEADARARAVDAVDEHGDRAFEAGIVADRADAADTGGAVRLGAGRGDEQRRRSWFSWRMSVAPVF
jgi:hypothetical protein